MKHAIRPPALSDADHRVTFTRSEVENLMGARVAAALRDAADYFDEYDEVTLGETDIGSNMVPVSPAERLRKMADGVDAS